ncbi:MAG: ABC transporter ATP-binding protein [Bacillota bacterium]
MPLAVEMIDITKIFPGVVANDRVSFSVEEGEIHALVGENGAGKTTLMNILYGLVPPDSGTIRIKGQEVQVKTTDDAIALGIGMVHQKFKLVPSFTIVQNICLGAEPRRSRVFIDERRSHDSVVEISQRYGLKIDPHATVRDCPVGTQQRVEILKTLYREADILILDEPTAVLTPQETRDLFNVVRSLVKQGKTVIFITHKLREVMEISDSVTVMRKGKVVGAMRTADTNPREIARMMVGREVLLRIEKKPPAPRDVVLDVKDLVVADNRGLLAVKGVSLTVQAGEILGVAGVEGNGQTELVEALTGLRPVERGTVKIGNTDVTSASPLRRRELGLSHIPEDRLTRGLNLRATIEENLIVTSHHKPPLSKWGVFNFPKRAEHADRLVAEFDIRATGRQVPARTLSGGNLQKVVVARELAAEPALLIAAQPTRGLDIGSIEFIHQRIVDARDQGQAVLLVSAELDEIMSLSDRIAVMYEGEIVGVVPGGAATEEELGLLMAGIKPDSAKAATKGGRQEHAG